MLVTLSGMVTLLRPVQAQKAPFPMLVTLAGMVKAPVTDGYAIKLGRVHTAQSDTNTGQPNKIT
jgi:hypothetical protein